MEGTGYTFGNVGFKSIIFIALPPTKPITTYPNRIKPKVEHAHSPKNPYIADYYFSYS